MKKKDLIEFLNNCLENDKYPNVDSMNGLQVDNNKSEVKKIGFAVDACQETINEASKRGCDFLFVHHGLFWGKSIPILGITYNRIKSLIDSSIALYASHIPLDANLLVGNNASMAKKIKLSKIERFGIWRGMQIGVKGILEKPMSLKEICKILEFDNFAGLRVLGFSNEEVKKVGIVSGGGAGLIEDALNQGCDTLITGESSHSKYHFCLENKINMICGGHYKTEIYGPLSLMELISKQFNICCEFIDIRTGL